MPNPNAPLRPSVFQVHLKDTNELHTAYISLFADGGVFIPTQRDFRLGDDVYLLLTMPGETRGTPLVCTVGWVTPAGSVGHRSQGIGARFPANDDTATQLKARIEQRLSPLMQTDRSTQTL